MSSRGKKPNTKELILTVTHANGGSIEGRTVLQKVCYFAGERLDLDLGFRPHYYGPFSSRIEDATDILVSQTLLRETIERIPTFRPATGFEPRKYTYQLTEQGRRSIRHQRLQSRKSYKEIKELLESIEKLSALNPSILSAAAKIQFIVSSEDKPLGNEEIKERAQDIGWELADGDIEKIGDLLVSLNFIEEVNG